jgi:hypothetical protein
MDKNTDDYIVDLKKGNSNILVLIIINSFKLNFVHYR